MRYKYPRTFHVPFSPGTTNDDKILKNLDHFIGKEIVITEKYDGENTNLYHDYTHARSIDSRHHESRNWLKKFHSEISWKMKANGDLRICGENLYAQHSIAYTDLLSYFYGFSAWEREICLSWDDTLNVFEQLGIIPVREMYRGIFDEIKLFEFANGIDTSVQEGFVLRCTNSFEYDDFLFNVAKWVRPGHVQTEDHWMTKSIVPNTLKT